MVDAVEPQIRELLQEYADDAGDGDRGADRLGPRRLTVLKDRVRELRPLYLPPDPASRTDVSAGRAGAVRPVVPAGANPARGRAGRVGRRCW